MCRETVIPRRPYLPPALYLLVALVVVDRLILGEGLGWAEGVASRATTALAAMLAVFAVAAMLRGRSWGVVPLALAVAMLSAVVSSSCVLDQGERFVEAMGKSPVSSWDVTVVSDPSQKEDVYRCKARATSSGGPSGNIWLSLPECPRVGDELRCVGSFAPNGQDEWGVACRQQGIWGSVRGVRILETHAGGGIQGILQQIRQRVLDVLEADRSESDALIAGCICGWRGGLAAFGLDELFSRCGLAHLIAVSGSHLAVFSTMLAGLLMSLRVRPRIRACALCACGCAFVMLCGAPPSAVRAVVMQAAALMGGLLGRRSHALTAVCVAGIVMVALDPAASGQLGFLLSLCAVAGLCVFSAYAAYALKVLLGSWKPPRMVPRRIATSIYRALEGTRDSIAASLVAQLVTLPLVAEAFGEVSLIGPLMSALVGVPFNMLLGLSLVGVALSWAPFVGDVALGAARLLAWAILMVVKACGSVPFACVPVTSVPEVRLVVCVGMVTVLLLWPRVSKGVLRALVALACVVACVMFVSWRYCAPARICVLDVGQGDAILVQQGAHAVLVDAGPGDAVVDALSRCHVMHLDAVIVTHLHADHYEGVGALKGRVGCDRVYVAEGVGENIPADMRQAWVELTCKDPEEVSWGDLLRVGDFALRVVWPEHSVVGDENADSLEILATYDVGGRCLSALLTGDAEQDETRTVVCHGTVGDIDVLKVGHHGSRVSIDERTALALDPEVAVASAGEGNKFGHPDPECVKVLRDAGASFVCTKDVGDVEVLPGVEGPTIRAQRTDEAQDR